MSNLKYLSCCKPFHDGKEKPETTTHPDKIRPNYQSQLEKSKNDTSWTGLEILSISMGQKSDKIGKVRFVAHYEMAGQTSSMEEHSRFKRYKGDWVYFDEKG